MMIPVSTAAVKFLHRSALTLSRIEAHGVRINVGYLDKVEKESNSKIQQIADRMKADAVYRMWKKRFGDSTKLGSREQLAEIVFGKEYLGYKPRKWTDTGRVAADKDALDDIDHPFVQDFLTIENIKKSVGTYLIGIRQEMVRRGDYYFVHPFYNLHTISTFRSSSNCPNFQNVPKRNPEMAKVIRPCYLPHPGHHFVEIDFSQLEVRIAACYHKDPNMIRYINDPNTDMHGDTAKEMFFLTADQVKDGKKTFRDSAKNQFVFPQFYGSNYVNCAKAIWKSMKMRKFMVGDKTAFQHLAANGVKELGDCVQGQEPRPGTFEAHLRECERRMWDKRFRVYTKWKKDWFDAYLKAGGFSMLTGFAVNGLFKRNDVTNYPIQGSAFHCLMWCLNELDSWLVKYRMRSKIIGEIHDAGQFSVHPAELQDFLNKAHETMTVALQKAWDWINVPLDVEADVSPVDGDWMSCKQWVPNAAGIWAEKA